MLDYQTALDNFRYDPVTGILYRKYKGRETTQNAPDSGGYLQVRFKGKLYAVHRVIWLMTYGQWPNDEIEHDDYNRRNNRLSNLKDWSMAQNRAKKQNNKSGHPCIFDNSKRSMKRPWLVQVYSKGKYLTQESFADLNDAIQHRDIVRKNGGLPAI